MKNLSLLSARMYLLCGSLTESVTEETLVDARAFASHIAKAEAYWAPVLEQYRALSYFEKRQVRSLVASFAPFNRSVCREMLAEQANRDDGWDSKFEAYYSLPDEAAVAAALGRAATLGLMAESKALIVATDPYSDAMDVAVKELGGQPSTIFDFASETYIQSESVAKALVGMRARFNDDIVDRAVMAMHEERWEDGIGDVMYDGQLRAYEATLRNFLDGLAEVVMTEADEPGEQNDAADFAGGASVEMKLRYMGCAPDVEAFKEFAADMVANSYAQSQSVGVEGDDVVVTFQTDQEDTLRYWAAAYGNYTEEPSDTDPGTPSEAQALAQKAAAIIEKVGREAYLKALSETIKPHWPTEGIMFSLSSEQRLATQEQIEKAVQRVKGSMKVMTFRWKASGDEPIYFITGGGKQDAYKLALKVSAALGESENVVAKLIEQEPVQNPSSSPETSGAAQQNPPVEPTPPGASTPSQSAAPEEAPKPSETDVTQKTQGGEEQGGTGVTMPDGTPVPPEVVKEIVSRFLDKLQTQLASGEEEAGDEEASDDDSAEADEESDDEEAPEDENKPGAEKPETPPSKPEEKPAATPANAAAGNGNPPAKQEAVTEDGDAYPTTTEPVFACPASCLAFEASELSKKGSEDEQRYYNELASQLDALDMAEIDETGFYDLAREAAVVLRIDGNDPESWATKVWEASKAKIEAEMESDDEEAEETDEANVSANLPESTDVNVTMTRDEMKSLTPNDWRTLAKGLYLFGKWYGSDARPGRNWFTVLDVPFGDARNAENVVKTWLRSVGDGQLGEAKVTAKSSVAETSDAGQEFISSKISKLRKEGYPEKQAIAIAMSMARKKGYDVPKNPNESEDTAAPVSQEAYYDAEPVSVTGAGMAWWEAYLTGTASSLNVLKRYLMKQRDVKIGNMSGAQLGVTIRAATNQIAVAHLRDMVKASGLAYEAIDVGEAVKAVDEKKYKHKKGSMKGKKAYEAVALLKLPESAIAYFDSNKEMSNIESIDGALREGAVTYEQAQALAQVLDIEDSFLVSLGARIAELKRDTKAEARKAFEAVGAEAAAMPKTMAAILENGLLVSSILSEDVATLDLTGYGPLAATAAQKIKDSLIGRPLSEASSIELRPMELLRNVTDKGVALKKGLRGHLLRMTEETCKCLFGERVTDLDRSVVGVLPEEADIDTALAELVQGGDLEVVARAMLESTSKLVPADRLPLRPLEESSGELFFLKASTQLDRAITDLVSEATRLVGAEHVSHGWDASDARHIVRIAEAEGTARSALAALAEKAACYRVEARFVSVVPNAPISEQLDLGDDSGAQAVGQAFQAAAQLLKQVKMGLSDVAYMHLAKIQALAAAEKKSKTAKGAEKAAQALADAIDELNKVFEMVNDLHDTATSEFGDTTPEPEAPAQEPAPAPAASPEAAPADNGTPAPAPQPA